MSAEGERDEGKEGEEPQVALAKQEDKAEEETCQRTKFLRENPAILQSFTAELLPPLLKVTNK